MRVSGVGVIPDLFMENFTEESMVGGEPSGETNKFFHKY
jgi:hypothetical protein